MNLQDIFSRAPRIVVADDDWLNRDLLKTYLIEAGCEVFDFPDGGQAWESIQNQSPDLALLDIMMPEIDGLKLCQRVKTNRRTQFIPIVIVTALDAEDEKLRAIEAGADDFIGKPFNPVILLTRLRSLLRLKHLHDELQNRNLLLNQVLNRYVDKDIAEVILTDPERHLKLGGETRYVTVLFADLRDFTTFSAMHAATEVVETVNLVFKELTQVIYQHGGTFDKYMGDAIMAFYGAPFSAQDDAARAAHTALEIQHRFSRLKQAAPSQLFTSLEGLGVGVHSGEAIVGNIGSEQVMDYTVVGDTVNIARRLQETARPGEILISGETLRQVSGAEAVIVYTERFKGNPVPLDIYALKRLKQQ